MPLFLSTYFLGFFRRVQKRNSSSHAFIWLTFDNTLVLLYQMKLQETLIVNIGGTVLKEGKMFYVAERLSAWSVNCTCRIQHY
jgi:hypothetical protein